MKIFLKTGLKEKGYSGEERKKDVRRAKGCELVDGMADGKGKRHDTISLRLDLKSLPPAFEEAFIRRSPFSP